MQQDYIFVGHSKGEFKSDDNREIKYDKIQLSNGIRVMAVENGTGKDSFPFHPEKTKVTATFEVYPVKGDVAKVRIVKLEEKK